MRDSSSFCETRAFQRFHDYFLLLIKNYNLFLWAVSLVGIVTKEEPYLIVLEFMHLGSLSGYLKSEFVKGKLETQRLIKMSGEICAGMFYLSSMGFVVRHV